MTESLGFSERPAPAVGMYDGDPADREFTDDEDLDDLRAEPRPGVRLMFLFDELHDLLGVEALPWPGDPR